MLFEQLASQFWFAEKPSPVVQRKQYGLRRRWISHYRNSLDLQTPAISRENRIKYMLKETRKMRIPSDGF
jgi:hypothetical protein